MSSSSPQEEVQGMALPAGMPLGSYRLLRVLGQGGFGITYLAEHTGSGQQVVIKENLPSAFAYRVSGSHRVYASGGAVQKDFDWALTRFVDEARILAALQHPGVVRVLECFEALGTAYYVMPWVGGEVLSKAAPAPAEITESWLLPQLRRLLVTLEYLHGRNVLHRDIKPANVLLQANGEPILIDFGAARIMVSERSATHIESEGYTPIEQLQSGSKHGPWTDLYALGATCYRLITGERPPRCVNRMGKRDCYQPLAARKELTQRFSPALLKGIDKALAIWPEDRWQSAAEWLRSLPAEKVKKEAPTEPSPSAQAPVKGSARLPWVLVLLLLAVLAAGGAGGVYHLNTAAEWEQKLTAAEQRATTAEQKLQEVAPQVEIGQKVKEEEARKAREEEDPRGREATREGARARLRESVVSNSDGEDLRSAAKAGDIEKVR
ncbi:MAG: serine/threonine protein kinase, partial [Akkermansia sp.]|nr:serine/threonine protein kinase [Akkermansia sp.]